MVECVSGKLVYQGAEDVSNKPAERLICQDCYAQVGQGISHSCTKLERQKEFDYHSKINIPNNARKSSV